MIASKDRSGYIGASDTDKVMGKWESETFSKWWLQKLSIYCNHFDNKYTLAGTYFEHRILDSLGLPIVHDRQFIIEPLRLRVNLDGDDGETNYECKTYKHENGFVLPKKYIQQAQVQMFGSGLHRTVLVAYGLEELDYNNYFRPIDPKRISLHPISYDQEWIENAYLPRLQYLSTCLTEGRWP